MMQTRRELIDAGYKYIFCTPSQVLASEYETPYNKGKQLILHEAYAGKYIGDINLLTHDFKFTKKGNLKQVPFHKPFSADVNMVNYFRDLFERAKNSGVVIIDRDLCELGYIPLTHYKRGQISYDADTYLIQWDCSSCPNVVPSTVFLYNLLDYDYTIAHNENLDNLEFPFQFFSAVHPKDL